jgi:hypothetical protein
LPACAPASTRQGLSSGFTGKIFASQGKDKRVIHCTKDFSCYSIDMDLDAIKLSIGRIERALNRIEQASSRLVGQTGPDTAMRERHGKLKSEVAATIVELDAILRGGTHG